MRFITGLGLALLLSLPLGCVQRGTADAPIGKTLDAPADLFEGERDGFGRALRSDTAKSSTMAASASSAKEPVGDEGDSEGEKLNGEYGQEGEEGEDGFYVRRRGGDAGGTDAGDSFGGGLTEVEAQEPEAAESDAGDVGEANEIDGADGGDGGDEE